MKVSSSTVHLGVSDNESVAKPTLQSGNTNSTSGSYDDASTNMRTRPPGYTFLGVVSDDVHLMQLDMQKYESDDSFFEDLKSEYHRGRGFLRRWLSIYKYAHCEFRKAVSPMTLV